MRFPRTINSEQPPGGRPETEPKLADQAPEEGTEGLPAEKQLPLEDPAQGKGIIPPYVERGTDMGVEY